MKNFRSLADFANHLTVMAAESKVVTGYMVEKGAESIQKIAKSEIAHYQPAVGPFAKWEELTAETEFEKIRLGYPVDAPLLRTGEMRDSISYVVSLERNAAVIGSDDQKMVWHEQGTPKMPPRAVLGPAAIRANEDLKPRFSRTIAAWLAGRSWRLPRLK
ncbi:hypothetical protein [Cupriavidus taiwanensis]|uniref:hypothetical protein n=1 Tax=Cupriavidus taiwanensis TaxID=164546 RepID=UPI000E101ED5|nr:hypothetical protein [Cupriavidus taiwanensis]SOY56859.1 Mu-like prophage protein gpG [Cupriavidus taiwanensis]SOY90800.1 Mu-like prophage protein gpG [Cupriavidus taiwanensis]SOZ63583.1 Mu-like prophage protein gpG [Cupriavidus taiwanensis]SOZ82609.1 Mu-like prophage protein gpG [Cupriavidus taiwanensis]SOZ84451.1 Mu-like prophage protein gpG [Cupriavidus taiwanensis]